MKMTLRFVLYLLPGCALLFSIGGAVGAVSCHQAIEKWSTATALSSLTMAFAAYKMRRYRITHLE